MKDKASGKVIYRTSFSSLFQEWVSEEEASRVTRGFENTFLLPCPKQPATVTIELKNVYHQACASLTHEINPDDILIHQRGTTHITPHRYLLQNGTPENVLISLSWLKDIPKTKWKPSTKTPRLLVKQYLLTNHSSI